MIEESVMIRLGSSFHDGFDCDNDDDNDDDNVILFDDASFAISSLVIVALISGFNSRLNKRDSNRVCNRFFIFVQSSKNLTPSLVDQWHEISW